MRTGSKWGLLEHLMADSGETSISSSQLLLERLARQHTRAHGNDKALINTLAEMYLPGEDKSIPWTHPDPAHTGPVQQDLDKPSAWLKYNTSSNS